MKFQTLCKYKDSLGKPNEGVHARRIFGVAFWDVFMTIVGGALIAKWFRVDTGKTILTLFVLGILAHRVFCVRTTIDKLLFP